MKKILLSIGTVTVMCVPTIGLVSCSGTPTINPVIDMKVADTWPTMVDMTIRVEIVTSNKIGLTIENINKVADEFVEYLKVHKATRRVKWQFWVDGDKDNHFNKSDTGVDMLQLLLPKITIISQESYSEINNYFDVEKFVSKQQLGNFIKTDPEIKTMVIYSVKETRENYIDEYLQSVAEKDVIYQLAHMTLWKMLNRANLS